MRGFTVTVLPDSRPDLLAGAQLDGLYFPDPADERAILREALARGIPVAAVDLTVTAGGMTIRTGYAAAVRAGLAHLAASGAEVIVAARRAAIGSPTCSEAGAAGRDPVQFSLA